MLRIKMGNNIERCHPSQESRMFLQGGTTIKTIPTTSSPADVKQKNGSDKDGSAKS